MYEAKKWNRRLLDEMPNIEIIILIGSNAQKYYLNKGREKSLTETVRKDALMMNYLWVRFAVGIIINILKLMIVRSIMETNLR